MRDSQRGKTEMISLDKAVISGFDNTKVGRQTLTVTYKGKTATFDVTVQPKSFARIEVTAAPDKISYLEAKETLNTEGGKLTLYYDNDTTSELWSFVGYSVEMGMTFVWIIAPIIN